MDLESIRKRVKSARRGFGSSDDWRLNRIDALLSHATDQAAQIATLEGELADVESGREAFVDATREELSVAKQQIAKLEGELASARTMRDDHFAEIVRAREIITGLRLKTEALTAERDAARGALKVMVYETTHLSSENDDGSHNCRISRDALTNARAELKEQTNG
jgi:predicted  nucleic acid-binding Zn-ribbon protein